MINADCQDIIPRDLINRRSIFIRVPRCSVFPLLVSFAQQILHLRLDQWLSMGGTSNLRHILKNHAANRTPRSYGKKQTNKSKLQGFVTKLNYPSYRLVVQHGKGTPERTCCQEDTAAWSTYHPMEADLGTGSGRTAQPSWARPGDRACSTAGGATACYPQVLKTQ